MGIEEIVGYIMAFGVVLGGVDQLLGNRLGFGARFEYAFSLLGTIALSMAGIICLAPVLSRVLGAAVTPVCDTLGLEPGIFGSVLAIDMGGYQLALDLARDPALGRFAAIVVSSIFGCTLVFTIPVGFATIREEDQPFFIRGILLGLLSMPAAIAAGAAVLGLGLTQTLRGCAPVLLISAALGVGILRRPAAVARLFQAVARGIRLVATLGLTLAAVTHLTGITLMPAMPPLREAMQTACAIAIAMLGSMPLAELLQRLLKRPLAWVRARTGLNGASTTALLLGMVSVTPALAMIPEMDRRGKVVNAAFLVCGASAMAAHLGFAMAAEPDMVASLLCAKLLGGVLGALLALVSTRDLAGGASSGSLLPWKRRN